MFLLILDGSLLAARMNALAEKEGKKKKKKRSRHDSLKKTESIMKDARVEKDASTLKKKKEKKGDESTKEIPVLSPEKCKGKEKLVGSPL